jgi:hypothetical protein
METAMKTCFRALLLWAVLVGAAAAQTDLAGTWQGRLEVAPGNTLRIHFVISAKPGGGYSAIVTSPDSGAIKNVAATRVTFADSKLTLDVPALSGGYAGTLRSGVLEGEWSQEGSKLPLSLRPYYVAVANYLDLPAAAREQLKGSWSGTLNNLAVMVRFETDAKGRTLGFFDSLQQNAGNIPITEATLAGTKLTFSVSYGAKYAGELSGNTLAGEWTQAPFPKPLPLTLTREKLTAEAAAPYLGLYWFEEAQRPIVIVLEKDRLALEIPGQTVRPLKKTDEAHVWSYVSNPNNLVKFQRDGDGPATAIDLRQPPRSAMLQRFKPEEDLPSLDELFKHRPARKPASLGTLRMSGSVKLTTSQQPGSFELLAAGNDRSRLKLNLDGKESQHVVAGDRAWVQYGALTPVQELPEARARSDRLNGWLLATVDWRGEFEQSRVLKRLELDGKPVFVVHAAPRQGRQRFIYLDAETGLTRGYDEVQALPELGFVGCEVRVADYREIDGVQIPFKITVKYSRPTLGTRIYEVEKIETHLKLDKDPFNIK